MHRYPDGLYGECRAAIAQFLRRDPSHVLLTTGVDEAVDLFLALGKAVLLFSPGFLGFEERARVWGRSLRFESLAPNSWDLPALGPGGPVADLVIVASPHNPSGRAYTPAEIFALAVRCRFLLCDETYVDFSSQPSLLGQAPPANVAVFRSFSKAFGLAGLRAGCVVAAPNVIAALEAGKAFFTVDTIALAGVAAAVRDRRHLHRTTGAIIGERRWLLDGLRSIPGLRVWDSDANFLLIAVADQRAEAGLVASLDAARVWVQPCAPMGLPCHFRVSIGQRTDNEKFLAAVRRTISQ